MENGILLIGCRYCGNLIDEHSIVCTSCYQELKEEIAELKEIIKQLERRM